MKIEQSLPDTAQFFYIALMVLLQRNPDSIVPEICHFLSTDQVIAFVRAFGGERVRVPTTKEFAFHLNIAVAAYYRYYAEFTWDKIFLKLKLSGNEARTLKTQTENFVNQLKEDTGLSIEEIFHA